MGAGGTEVNGGELTQLSAGYSVIGMMGGALNYGCAVLYLTYRSSIRGRCYYTYRLTFHPLSLILPSLSYTDLAAHSPSVQKQTPSECPHKHQPFLARYVLELDLGVSHAPIYIEMLIRCAVFFAAVVSDWQDPRERDLRYREGSDPYQDGQVLCLQGDQ